MSMCDRHESAVEVAGLPAQSSALTPSDALSDASKSARSVALRARPPALIGVALPGRDRNTRRAVMKLYTENPHLPASARFAVANRVRLERVIARAYARLQKADFAPGRDADLFMKSIAEARSHDRDLCLLPGSLAALGVDLTRLHKMGAPEAPDGPAVEELEARYIEGRSE